MAPPKAIPQQGLAERLRPAAITYVAVCLPRIFGILSKKGALNDRLLAALLVLLRPSKSSVKLAAFPALLPLIYQSIRPYVEFVDTPYAREITALLSSPVVLLLPHGLRIYLALYTVTSAMTTFLRSASPREKEEKRLAGREGEKNWREYLPPVTVLNALGNAWMAYSWFHEKGVFPKSYEKIILDHSPHYRPQNLEPYELRDFLEKTLSPPVGSDSTSGHAWHVCQVQHPGEPSCVKNHLLAWRDGAPQVSRWVAGFGALSVLVGWKKNILKNPAGALLAWLDYTVRGALYVNGSVQTLWATTCALQRLFPGEFMPKSRWLINGSMASLWVYALPKKRQSEISIYVARIAALSAWRAWLKHFPRAYVPKGEVLLLAAGWISLLRLRDEGWRIEGLMRRATKFVEGRVDELRKEASTFSPDVSRSSSVADLSTRSTGPRTSGGIDVGADNDDEAGTSMGGLRLRLERRGSSSAFAAGEDEDPAVTPGVELEPTQKILDSGFSSDNEASFVKVKDE